MNPPAFLEKSISPGLTNLIGLLYWGYMSKYAVLLLPIFIISVSITKAFISDGMTAVDTIPIDQILQTTPETWLVAQNYPRLKPSSESQNPKVIKILITAYSSSPDETDDTPLITASGSYVRRGVVAANFLPFNTRIRVPKIFGDEIFIVEDRLHQDYNDRVDIWFPSKEEAIKFGSQITEIEIL